MSSLTSPSLKVYDPPAASPSQAFAVSDLVGRIANALDCDGSFVADGTLDSGGMTLVAGRELYRVEVAYVGPADPNEVQEQIDRDLMRAEDSRRLHSRLEQLKEEADRDWMAHTGDDMPF
jgi:hypothetical protein